MPDLQALAATDDDDGALKGGVLPAAGREEDPTAVIDGVLIAAAKYQGGPLRPWWRWSRGSSPLSPKGPHILPSAARLSSTLSIFFSLKVPRSSRVDQSS